MKKLTISIIAVFIFTGLSAGDKLSFSVRGGLNISNPSLNLESYSDVSKNVKLGVNIGLFGDYMYNEHVGAQSGLLFSTQGTKYSFTQTQKVTLSFNTLQLPLHLLYKFKIAENFKIRLHAGPHLAYAVSGRETNVFNFKDVTDTKKYNIYSEKTMLKYGRFDFGLGLGIGLEYKKYLLDIGYDWGVIDQIKDETINQIHKYGTYRARNLYLTVGYKF